MGDRFVGTRPTRLIRTYVSCLYRADGPPTSTHNLDPTLAGHLKEGLKIFVEPSEIYS